MNSQRNVNLDLLRVFSAFAVVAIHVTTNYLTDRRFFGSSEWMFSNILNNASRFAVPMFFMISGFFTLNNEKNTNYSYFYKKKLPKILIPFIVWSIFYAIFYLESIGSLTIFSIFKQIAVMCFGAPAYYHLWFFYHLIGLYLVTPVIVKLINHINVRDAVILLILFFFQNSIIGTYTKVFHTTSYIDIPFSEYALIYFLIGGLFGKFGMSHLLKYKKWIYLLAFISLAANIIGTIIFTSKTGTLSTFFMAENLLTVFVYSLAIYTLISTLNIRKLPQKAKIFILNLSGLSFGIYLIHPFVLDFFIKAVHLGRHAVFAIIIELFLTCFISTILTMVIKKIPYFHYLIP